MFVRQKTRAQRAESDDIDSLSGAISPEGLGRFAHREVLVVLQPSETLPAFGLLVLGSPDPTRYAAQMGTEFLSRIGEVASASLSRLLAKD